MLRQTGIGAKTSSGFGQARDELKTVAVLWLGGKAFTYPKLTQLAAADGLDGGAHGV
jgi:hypothetical protein